MAALETGMQCTNADFLTLWCIAISLTRWFDKGEIGSLGDLRSAMLRAVNGDDQHEELAAGFKRIPRGRMPEQSFNIVEEAEDSHQTGSPATHDAERRQLLSIV